MYLLQVMDGRTDFQIYVKKSAKSPTYMSYMFILFVH